MKKQVFFGLLICSWILGVSLICLFPPIPDYKVADQESGYLSQDSTPELHLRNTFRSGFSTLDLGIELVGLFFEFQFKSVLKPLIAIGTLKAPFEIQSFFDTKILFRPFFDTW
ncbi:hypothetical protein B0E43_17520 [Algoriphagus sp. A40]|nr:hypothetical protein B0E43_17520 [Algoriphagus sp. A40]